jgi:uncharacterized protein (DUF2267 family)
MSLNFENYAQKGHEFVNHLAVELGTKDISHAGRVLRCVLHALRNRLTHEESFQLLAQLPMAIKAVYVDGWKFSTDFKRLHHIEDFMDEVLKEDGMAASRDFRTEDEVKIAVEAVFKTLARYVSAGEIRHMIAVLPRELKALLTEAVAS